MINLLSYCGLFDARISASEKDLPVLLEAAGARGADDLRLFIAATVAVVGPVVVDAVIFLIMSLLATSEADIIENPLELADLAAAAV